MASGGERTRELATCVRSARVCWPLPCLRPRRCRVRRLQQDAPDPRVAAPRVPRPPLSPPPPLHQALKRACVRRPPPTITDAPRWPAGPASSIPAPQKVHRRAALHPVAVNVPHPGRGGPPRRRKADLPLQAVSARAGAAPAAPAACVPEPRRRGAAPPPPPPPRPPAPWLCGRGAPPAAVELTARCWQTVAAAAAAGAPPPLAPPPLPGQAARPRRCRHLPPLRGRAGGHPGGGRLHQAHRGGGGRQRRGGAVGGGGGGGR
jgi:hypothetical protein